MGFPVPPVSPPNKKEERGFGSKVAEWAAKGAADEAGKAAFGELLHRFKSHDDSDEDEEKTGVASSVIEKGMSGVFGILSDD